MAYTQEELDALKAKYPGIDINAITQASGARMNEPPPLTPEEQARNAAAAAAFQARQASPFGGGDPAARAAGTTVETDANGIKWIVNADGSRVQEGNNTGGFLGTLGNLGNNLTLGLLPKGNDVLQKIVNTQPIYQTGEINKPVASPFGGYPITIPAAQGTPIGNQIVNGIGDALKGLSPGAGGGAAPPPGAPLNPGAFGWGNFSPAAQQQSGFFNDLAAYHANQAAPQLQRTGVDWSGMGGGTGPIPSAPQPQSAYPTMAATAAGGGAVTSPYSSGALSGTYGPQKPQQAIAAGPGVSATPGGPYGPTPQAPAPPPQQPPQQNAPSTSQFANPLFQQEQGARAQTQDVMGNLMNPGMYANSQQGVEAAGRGAQVNALNRVASPGLYATPQSGVEAAGRSTEMTALNRAADPNMFRTGDATNALQSRGIQGATMANTTASNLYNTPGAAQQDAARQQQQGFLARLNADMNGAQPSLAEMQLRRGSDATVANANALAASAGPQGAAMARRQAMQTAASQGGRLAADTAELRAKEYAQARQEAGGALTNFRGQDITNQGQGFQNITSTADRAAQQAIALRSADLQAAGMSYDNAIKQAQLEQTGAQGLRSGDLQRLGMDFTNATSQAQLEQTAAQNLRSGDIQRLGQEYANTSTQAQLASQQALQTRAQDLQALGMSYDNAFKQAQLEAQQNQFQGTMDMQQRGLNLQGEQMGYGMGLDIQNADMASRQHLADLEAQRYAADRNFQFQAAARADDRFDKYLGAGVSGVSTLLSLVSDKRKKKDVEKADPEDLSDFLGKLNESTYRYKNEKHGKGEQFGIMAQDLEKSRLGKTLVIDTPDGKMVDTRKASLASLALLAALDKRMRKVEARR